MGREEEGSWLLSRACLSVCACGGDRRRPVRGRAGDRWWRWACTRLPHGHVDADLSTRSRFLLYVLGFGIR